MFLSMGIIWSVSKKKVIKNTISDYLYETWQKKEYVVMDMNGVNGVLRVNAKDFVKR